MPRSFIRMNISETKNSMNGFRHSKETKIRIGKANKGNIPWIKGRHHSEKTKTKIGLANKGRSTGQIPWNKGKHLSSQIREKLSASHKGQIPWSLGEPMLESTKRILRESRLGSHHSIETRMKMSKLLKLFRTIYA